MRVEKILKWLSFSQYSSGEVMRSEVNYVSFGLFMPFIYMIPLFMHMPANLTLYNWLLIIKGIGTMLCVGLLLRPYWPSWLQQRLTIYWYSTLFYCLPFTFTLLFLMNGYSVEWLINVSLAITLLSILADWLSFIVLCVLGTLLGLLVYWRFMDSLPLLDIENLFLLLYTCSFSVAISLIFARRKEQSFNALLLQNQQLTESQQATRRELAATLTYREHLLQELKPDEIALFDDMTTAYIQQAIYRMTDYMRLDVTMVNLDMLQKSITDLYNPQDMDKPQLVFKKNTPHHALQADLRQLKQLLLNAINYVQHYNRDSNPITIALEDAVLGHEVAHMPNYTRTLEALKITITTTSSLPLTQPLYKINPAKFSTWVPQQEEEFLLIENARIIDAHYGYMNTLSTHTQVYVLPVKLREIRGKVMELIKEPVSADPEELKHPLSIQLEKQLMEKLQGTQVDIAVVKKALDIIKKYHSGVKRKSGEPFFTHPLAVALIVLEYSTDQAAILGALLHDTVEDTSLSLADIERIFGQLVGFLVGKATNLEDHKRRINLNDRENLIRILNYEDPRAALIKLSDRLHNMRTIEHHPWLVKQKHIAQETLDEFVPLARKLGLDNMTKELEQLSRAVLAKKG